MNKIKKNLCIIPAREGSKGIKNKNLKFCNDKMLIEWVIEAALSSKLLDQIFCSTDSKPIANIAEKKGIDTYPLRPKRLAEDKTSIFDVIDYTLKILEKKNDTTFDNVILIQPSSPFVTYNHIDDSINKLCYENYDTIISAVRAGANHPGYMFFSKNDTVEWVEKNYFSRRQDLPEVYLRVGNVYSFKRENIKENVSSFYGNKIGFIEIEKLRSITIDEPADLIIANSIANYLKGK